jgi:hypothetical protein
LKAFVGLTMLASAALGCEAVPDLTFLEPDGGEGGAVQDADAGGGEASCSLPPGAATCCGTIPCFGKLDFCQSNCMSCMNCAVACCARGMAMTTCTMDFDAGACP